MARAAKPKAEKPAKPKREYVPSESKIPAKVNRVGLTKALTLTARTVERHTAAGVFKRGADGLYDLAGSIRDYLAFREEYVASKFTAESSADKLRKTREAQILRKMEIEDRNIVSLEEALERIDELTGVFLETLTGLPARITNVPQERRRIEAIIDDAKERLATRFAEKRDHLRTGQPPAETTGEDDA